MNDHQCSSTCRREGCPNCPHGKGSEEHCDVCDAVTKESDEKPFYDCGIKEAAKTIKVRSSDITVNPIPDTKPQDWETEYSDLFYPDEGYGGSITDKMYEDGKSFIRSLLDSRYQEGVMAKRARLRMDIETLRTEKQE